MAEDKKASNLRQAVDFGALVAFMGSYAFLRFARGMESSEALIQATWVLVGASILALLAGWLLEKRLAPLPLFSGLFALVFGTLTIFFHDPNLLKIKITVQNLALSVILLGSLVFNKAAFKYLLGSAFNLTDAGWKGLTLRYGLFFLTVAIVNEVIWRTQTDDFWVAFRGGLWIASAAFGIWQVFFIMKHLIRDDETDPKSEEA
ncbi:Intracellular septation protein A [Brevundimonas sp. GN22]|uniref:inner membrane-spanning protein YciB n=1 Tax=Brevundimonas pishanensis TaxID=2896315 RepID=UPI001FA74148|nr:septation protein IspZ [Brevundimonas pishanensis]